MKPNKTMNRKKYGTSKEGGENDADGSKEKIPLKQEDLGIEPGNAEEVLSSHAEGQARCETEDNLDTLKPPNVVTLYVSCTKLINLDLSSETDPQVKMFVRDENKSDWVFDEQTEVLQNTLDPIFTKSLTINYYFEKTQHIRFEVYDGDGEAN